MPLSDSQCRAPNVSGKREKRSDGGGLRLVVSPNGKRQWELAYRWQGKPQTLALGAYPAVGLAQARLERERVKVDLQAGRRPRRAGEPEPQPERPPCRTFRKAAEEWLAVAGEEWKESHRERVASRLRMNLLPDLGDKRLDDITAPDVLAVVRKVEARGAKDIRRRTVQAVGSIYRFAIAHGWVTHNPAADLRGALAPRPRVRHHAMVAPKDMGAFLLQLRGYDGDEMTRLALEAVIRTAVRTAELRFGTWAEVDGDLWRIPGERMKVEGIDHLVPLPPQVKRLLARAKEIGGGSPYMFPGQAAGVLSSGTLIFALYRLGLHSRATVHGFRRTFSTWSNEQAPRWHPDVIERQLSHWDRDEIRGAYNAAEWLPQRRELMAAWNDWLDVQADLAELL